MGANDQVPLHEVDEDQPAAKRVGDRLAARADEADAERRLRALRDQHEQTEREQARERAALLRVISPQLRSDEAELRGRHWHSTRTYIADTVTALRRELADASAQRTERAEVVAAARTLAEQLSRMAAGGTVGEGAADRMLGRIVPGLLALQGAVGRLVGAERAAEAALAAARAER